MNPPLLHPSFAFPPTGFGRQVDPFAPRPQPTLLVGIQRDLAPPLAWGSTRLQRMRIIRSRRRSKRCVERFGHGLDLAKILFRKVHVHGPRDQHRKDRKERRHHDAHQQRDAQRQ